MKPLDWIVLFAFLTFTLLFGIFKGRGNKNIRSYMLADKTMPWYAVALSIMATQASAITFLSTTGQAYADGMRFVQFYFGLPIAMVILAAVAVPIFHKLNVYTAYEFLEKRFDLKTRVLTGFIFLVQRGLGAGLTLYAPALILSVVLGWDIRWTLRLTGLIVITYIAIGGVKGVNWNDFQQFLIVMVGMAVACAMTVYLLPDDVSFLDAVSVAGASGRLNAVDFSFDWQNRYTFWSGLIGGMFVALAYFGTDQSQVQRYLTGRSISHSKIGLLFNGLAKVPMQFFILFTGAMVFVFYQFISPPLFFNKEEVTRIQATQHAAEFSRIERQYEAASQQKLNAVSNFLDARKSNNSIAKEQARQGLLRAQANAESVRQTGIALMKKSNGDLNPNDTNYVFLTFVTTYLPAGLVGLLIIVVFASTMAASSSELNALATATIVDVYKRLIKKEGSERHYLVASRVASVFWGLFAISLAERASRLGTLVEAVNILGSLFYGTVLGVFVLAFFFKFMKGTPVFLGAICGQALVLYLYKNSDIVYLWFNVFGCLAVIGSAFVIHSLMPILKTNRSGGSNE
jgi:SSS family transporter